MKQERKIYDPAFKTKAVQLSNERTNISVLASELGIKAKQRYGSPQMTFELNATLNYKTVEEFNNQNRIYKNVA